MHIKRKAQFFSFLLVFIVVGALAVSYVYFDKKKNSFDYDIGERQIGLLRTYMETEKSLLYADHAFEIFSRKALYDLGQAGGYYTEPGCGSDDGTNIWIYKGRICIPDKSVLRRSYYAYLKEKANLYFGDREKKVYVKVVSNPLFGSSEVEWSPVVFEGLADILLTKLPEYTADNFADKGPIDLTDEEKLNVIKVTELENEDLPTLKDGTESKISWEVETGGNRAEFSIFEEKTLNIFRSDNYEFFLDDLNEVYRYTIEDERAKWEPIQNEELRKKLLDLADSYQDLAEKDLTIGYKDGGVEKEIIIEEVTDELSIILEKEKPGIVFYGKSNDMIVMFAVVEGQKIYGIASSPLVVSNYCNEETRGCGAYAPRPNLFSASDTFSIFYGTQKKFASIWEECNGMANCIQERIDDMENWNIVKKEEDSIKIKVIAPEDEYFIYGKEGIEKMPLEIHFAIVFADNQAPPPIEKLEVSDYYFNEKHVLLQWSASPAPDVEKYLIYHEKANNEISEISGVLVNEEMYIGNTKEFSDVLADIDIENPSEDHGVPLFQFSFLDDAGNLEYRHLQIEPETLYYMEKEKQYIYALRLDEDDQDYAFAVTAVDHDGNEDRRIIESAVACSIDDMPPATVSGIVIDQTSMILSWKKPILNMDNTEITDLAGYHVYAKDSYFEETAHDAALVATVNSEELQIDSTVLTKGSEYYFIVTAFDDQGNQYKKGLKPLKIKVN